MKRTVVFMLAMALIALLAGCAADAPGAPITKPNFKVDKTVMESDRFIVPDIVSSGCVLQQNATLKLWGQYPVDGPVAVEINEALYYGECVNGRYEVMVRTGPASKDNTMTLYTAEDKKVLRDIWFGEVFLCAGQSNMQANMADINAAELAQPTLPRADLRMATVAVPVTEQPSSQPQGTASMPWTPVEAANLAACSAAGYFFGLRMQETLACPVGIVVCAAGDTIVASWLAGEDAAGLPPVYQEERAPYWVRSPAHMYNTMLYPLLNMHFKAVVWYQGENQSYRYDEFLTALITGWRRYFNRPDLSFTVVELVGCGESWLEKWPEIRAMQRSVCETLDGCALAVGIDLGEEFNIHPADKRAVGDRAAYATLNALYGRAMPSGPVLKDAVCRDGAVVLTYDNADGLYVVNGGAGFEVSMDGIAYYDATPAIRGNTVSLTCGMPGTPRFVRYAWRNYAKPMVCLYNGTDMPADSFHRELNPDS